MGWAMSLSCKYNLVHGDEMWSGLKHGVLCAQSVMGGHGGTALGNSSVNVWAAAT